MPNVAEKTVSLVSLGCSKNLVDSEVMLGLLQGAGYRITTDADEADAVIVNTCGFLGAAVEESLQALGDMAKLKTGGRCKALIAAGCLPQRDAQLITMRVPEVDAILGTTDFGGIVNTIESIIAPQAGGSAGPPLASDISRGNLIQIAVTPTRQHSYVYDHVTPRVRATPRWT